MSKFDEKDETEVRDRAKERDQLKKKIEELARDIERRDRERDRGKGRGENSTSSNSRQGRSR